MIDGILQNIGTIVIGLLVTAVVAAIIVKIARDKKKGKCVGCDCGNNVDCPSQMCYNGKK